MKNILLENMLRFGTKNLSEKTQRTLQKLAEQGVAAPIQNKPRSAVRIYNIEQLSNPADYFKGNVYFKLVKGSPDLYLSKSTSFIKNVFGSNKTLLSLDLYSAVGTDEYNIKPSKHYGLVLRWAADEQVKYGGDKTIDPTNRQQALDATNQLNKTFDESYFPMMSLNPDISGAMTAENMALLITKAFIKYIRLGKQYEGVYKAGINAIMANLSNQPGLLTTPWDENAVNRLRTAIEKDTELTNASGGLINSLNV